MARLNFEQLLRFETPEEYKLRIKKMQNEK